MSARLFEHHTTLTDGLPVRVEYDAAHQEITGVFATATAPSRVRAGTGRAQPSFGLWRQFNIIESLKPAVLARLRAECEDALV